MREPIIVQCGIWKDGVTYALHPLSRKALEECMGRKPLNRTISVSYRSGQDQPDPQIDQEPILREVVAIVTGSSWDELQRFGVKFVEPASGQEWTVAKE